MGGGAAATYTATFLDDGVMLKPAGLVMLTPTFSPSNTEIAEIASVRVNPVPVRAPFVAPVTVMSLACNAVVGSVSKVRVSSVVVTKPLVPFAVRPLHETAVGAATYTATFLDEGVMLKPAGLVMLTPTFSPSNTEMSEIASVRVVPVPVNAPFVAPVTVMSLACSDVGSVLKVSVSSVVVTKPLVPFAVRPLHATDVGVGENINCVPLAVSEPGVPLAVRLKFAKLPLPSPDAAEINT